MTIPLDGYLPKQTELEISGIKLKFSELTLGDLAEFKSDIKQRRDKYRREHRQELIEVAKELGDIDPLKLLEQLDKPLSEEQVEAEMETVEGLNLLILLSLRRAHPGISAEQVGMIVSVSRLDEIVEAILPGQDELKKKLTARRQAASAIRP